MIFVAADNQSRRIRRHDQTNPTRLKTQFLNGLLTDYAISGPRSDGRFFLVMGGSLAI